MGLDLGYKMDVAAIPMEFSQSFLCHSCRMSWSIVMMEKESVSIVLMKQNMQQKHGLEISLQNFSKMV